jgi:VIT1/CCC1 family predicted Fe2+/Mn2+ transporter
MSTFDIKQFSTWVPVVAGVIIPFVVALIAKADASGTVKSLLAVLAAALVALGLYLGDASHAQTWKGAASIFVLTLITAGASRVTLTEDKVQAVAAKVPGGIG